MEEGRVKEAHIISFGLRFVLDDGSYQATDGSRKREEGMALGVRLLPPGEKNVGWPYGG